MDVVSPQYPCGAAWLANALLELQVPLGHLWGYETSAEWQDAGQGISRYADAAEPWRQTLAALRPGREFRFIEGLRPRFSHAFPWQLPATRRTIWMVRDPRDALYSEWQRQRRNEALDPRIDLPTFLRQPFLGGPASVADVLWLHLSAWLHVARMHPQQVLMIRFEDRKRAPASCLATVAQWLGMNVEGHSLRSAALASDVSHLQAVEIALTLRDPNARQFNRRGAALEWEGSWPRAWHAALGPEWEPLFEALGYAPAQAEGAIAAAAPCDLRQTLAWRELSAPVEMDRWMEILAPLNAKRRTAP